MDDLKKHGRKVEIRGIEFPVIEKVENVAPYNIEKINAIKISQKKAKTVTVYE